MKRSRELLSFLFLESQAEDLNEGTTGKVTGIEELTSDLELQKAAQEKVEGRQGELVKILNKIGISDAASRLTFDGDCFHLVSGDPETHLADSEVLFDLTQITPLIDANFVCVDGEADENDERHILILSADQNGEAPDLDEVLADPAGNKLPALLERMNPKDLLDKLLA